MPNKSEIASSGRTERGAPVRCMEWLSRIVCKWKGHDEVNNLQAWECTRCRMVMDYDEAVKTPWRDRLRGWLKSKKDWVEVPGLWPAIWQNMMTLTTYHSKRLNSRI